MMAAAYFLLRAARDLPRPRWRHVIAFGIFFGAALGIRVLGLLLAGYVALAIFVSGPSWRANLSQAIEFYARSVTALLPAFVIAYLIMIVAWPWSALSPLNPIRGLFDFGEFHYQIRTLLGGHIYEMANVPRWYVPAYLLFKLPLIIVAGAIVSIVFILWPRSEMSGHSRRRNDTLNRYVQTGDPGDAVQQVPPISRHIVHVVVEVRAAPHKGAPAIIPVEDPGHRIGAAIACGRRHGLHQFGAARIVVEEKAREHLVAIGPGLHAI